MRAVELNINFTTTKRQSSALFAWCMIFIGAHEFTFSVLYE